MIKRTVNGVVMTIKDTGLSYKRLSVYVNKIRLEVSQRSADLIKQFLEGLPDESEVK